MKPPLSGIRVIEFEGIGPGPLAGRMLADMGAEVTVIARLQKLAVAEQLGGEGNNPLRMGKRVTLLDLKQPVAVTETLERIASADAVIEGNRPGVMERLGLGPAECAERNPRLVYGRMTGWGQSGPLAQAAGHDLNYVALTGLLSLSAHRGQRPIVPPTVVGDAAGALGLVFGMVCALLDAKTTGQGRVVDGAIVDTVSMLGSIAHMVRAGGRIDCAEPSPFHDSPFYDVYACADGGCITLGAIEPRFYALLLDKLGLVGANVAAQYDKCTWSALKARFVALFASQSRAHWQALLEGTDVCFAPVLTMEEAIDHPHNVARGIFRVVPGYGIIAASAPQFLPLSGSTKALRDAPTAA